MPRLLSAPADVRWTVVALCAAWCDTCSGYFTLFAERARSCDDARHVWIDIEDDSDALGDLEVETLPTLLVLHDDRPLFFGPVLPHADVVDRTLRALMQHGAMALPVEDAQRESVEQLIARLADGATIPRGR